MIGIVTSRVDPAMIQQGAIGVHASHGSSRVQGEVKRACFFMLQRQCAGRCLC